MIFNLHVSDPPLVVRDQVFRESVEVRTYGDGYGRVLFTENPEILFDGNTFFTEEGNIALTVGHCRGLITNTVINAIRKSPENE